MTAGEIFELERVLSKLFGHTPEPEGGPGPFAKINTKLDWIIKHMATKKDLDAAIAQVKQDTADAAQRATKALGDLLDKVNAGEDFSAEVDALKAAHNDLINIAGDAAGTTSQAPATSGEQPAPVPAPAPAPLPGDASQGNTTPGGAPGTAAPTSPTSTAPTDNPAVQAQTAATLSPGGAQGGQTPSGMNQNPSA